jgi:hypothetical protein
VCAWPVEKRGRKFTGTIILIGQLSLVSRARAVADKLAIVSAKRKNPITAGAICCGGTSYTAGICVRCVEELVIGADVISQREQRAE